MLARMRHINMRLPHDLEGASDAEAQVLEHTRLKTHVFADNATFPATY